MLIGCSAVWAFYNWGELSVSQTILNLAKIAHISPIIYLQFIGWVICPAILLTFLPNKIHLFTVPLALAAFICEFNIISYLRNKNVYNDLYEQHFIPVDVQNLDLPDTKKI